jgi:hypothetical protein
MKLTLVPNGVNWQTEDRAHAFCEEIMEALFGMILDKKYVLTALKRNPKKKNFVRINLVKPFAYWNWYVAGFIQRNRSQKFFANTQTEILLDNLFPFEQGVLWCSVNQIG